MTSDKIEYILSPVNAVVFTDWDNLLGFPVEKILPEYFFIDRAKNLVGVTTVQIAMIEFDKIMGSVNELLSLENVPSDVLDDLLAEGESTQPKTFFERVNPLSKIKTKEKVFDPTRILKLIYAINRVRFELFSFVIVQLSNLQAKQIKELYQQDRMKNYEGLHLAYRDLLNRSSKKDKEAHYKANPNFIRHLPEDGLVVHGTTVN